MIPVRPNTGISLAFVSLVILGILPIISNSRPQGFDALSETKAALEAAHKHGWGTVVSARSGETEDPTVTHLAIGWNAGQLKVGSFARSERMVKWNEALRIEAELGREAHFVVRAASRNAADQLKDT